MKEFKIEIGENLASLLWVILILGFIVAMVILEK